MKILIFSTNYLPNIGGAEIAVKEITDRLGTPKHSAKAAIGTPQHTFTLIAPRLSRALPKKEQIGNVTVHRVGFGTPLDKFLIPFLGSRKAKKLHKTHHYDAAWSIMASHASVAAAWFKKAHPSVPLILTLQEGDEEAHLKRYVFGNDTLYRWLIRPWHLKVFQYADHATAISTYLKDRAEQNGIPADRITIVPNGVDLERFQKLAGKGEDSVFARSGAERNDEAIHEARGKRQGFEEPDRAGKSLAARLRSEGSQASKNLLRYFERSEEIPKRCTAPVRSERQHYNEKIIFTASRLVRKNAIGDLISAMKHLPEETVLIIAGDGEEREALKARAYKYGRRVRFIGTVTHDELPAYLHAADVFVRPSLSEGMGNAFIEAMAAGVPVVATPVGGIPDFLEHEQTGLFCTVRDPKSIADQISRILTDEALRKRITQNAHEMVQTHYTWDAIATQMHTVFTNTIRTSDVRMDVRRPNI